MNQSVPDLRLVKIGATVFAAGGSLLYPPLISAVTLPILALVIIFLGIPHGALDHIIGQKLLQAHSFKYDRLLFYGIYLSLAGLMGLFWLLSPPVAFVIFLACAIYHFGEADLYDLEGSKWTRKGLFVSRGLMVIGLLVFSRPTITHPLILDISGFSLYSIYSSIEGLKMVGVLFGMQYIMALASYLYAFETDYRSVFHLIGDALLLFILFLTTPSLLAFAIYFGIWHSWTHIVRIKKFLSHHKYSLSMKGFYRRASLFTLPLLGILSIALYISPASIYDVRSITIIFVLISIITFPHVFLVRWMYTSMIKDEVGTDLLYAVKSRT